METSLNTRSAPSTHSLSTFWHPLSGLSDELQSFWIFDRPSALDPPTPEPIVWSPKQVITNHTNNTHTYHRTYSHLHCSLHSGPGERRVHQGLQLLCGQGLCQWRFQLVFRKLQWKVLEGSGLEVQFWTFELLHLFLSPWPWNFDFPDSLCFLYSPLSLFFFLRPYNKLISVSFSWHLFYIFANT